MPDDEIENETFTLEEMVENDDLFDYLANEAVQDALQEHKRKGESIVGRLARRQGRDAYGRRDSGSRILAQAREEVKFGSAVARPRLFSAGCFPRPEGHGKVAFDRAPSGRGFVVIADPQVIRAALWHCQLSLYR